MNAKNERILIIDDNPSIHEDFRKILCQRPSASATWLEAKAALFGTDTTEVSDPTFELDSAYQGKEGLEKVRQAITRGEPFALAFVDVRMPPGWDGVETILRLWEVDPELQVVICTAYSDYSWDQIIERLGKSDSLVILKKPFDNVEVLQLAQALTEKWGLNQQAKLRLADLDRMVSERTEELRGANEQLQREIAERRQMEAALRASQERFAKAFHASPIPMAIQKLAGEQFVDVNEAFLRRLDFARDNVIGCTPEQLELWADANEHEGFVQALKRDRSVKDQECRFRARTGQPRQFLVSAELFDLGTEPNLLFIAEDISERRELEDQLRQAQKMEAVGQLAAGIAHDFNNLLTIIQGHVNVKLEEKNLDDDMTESLEQVGLAAERAANLTRQLLAFSSKQIVQPKVLRLGQVIFRMRDLLTRVVGEQIRLECDCGETLPPIKADEGNVEQILMNLAVNARDAMPKGGRLSVSARAVHLDEAAGAGHPEARAGEFVCLTVTDSGCGMDPSVLPHIFEPFYTTKEVGKGTGLGLATVYGIVKQHGGWIQVNSRPGHGSEFRVFLPVCDQGTEPLPQVETALDHLQGRERVLVVEDEPLLRDMVRTILAQQGYTVHEASNGVEALEVWQAAAGKFDLLITDIVMPQGVSGKQLANRLRQQAPDLKVLFSSGYSSEMVSEEINADANARFLQKPYKPTCLLGLVREILSSGSGRPARN